MTWRTILIQNPARLALASGQIRIESGGGGATFPLEDLAALILESPQITLTAALLSACAEAGVALIPCDAAHTPCGVLLPADAHCRHAAVARDQVATPPGLKARLWQRLVRAKIQGQAAALDASGADGAPMRALAARAQPGDPDNREAAAAKAYWPALMGPDFRRMGPGSIPAALNYGYAVIRAAVARAIVGVGLMPAFGLHHASALNAFNLADDLVEPLRPLVDRAVRALRDRLEGGHLDSPLRADLAALLGADIHISGQTHTVLNACEAMAQGLVAAIRARDPAALPVPDWGAPK